MSMNNLDFSEFLVSVTDPKGKIIQVNENFCKVSKFSEDEIIGKTHALFKSGLHPPSFYKSLWDTLTQGKMWSGLIKNKAKDGSFYWVQAIMIPILDIHGNTMQYVCNSTNVDLKVIEQTKIIQNAINESSIVAITDTSGKITYANKEFCKISKYSQEELIGKTHAILKSGYHDESFYKNMWDVITSGKIWKGDIKNKSKDGSFYWVRTMIMPIFSDDGKIKNFIAIRTDITSQVKLSEQLIQSERMSSIGQLSARMAHDIRNPLSIIRIALENLKLRYGADESAEKSFDRVTRSIDRIAHQTDDVLDFVRGFTPKLFKVKLSQIIEESTDSLTIPWNVTLILPKNDVEFFADGRLFSRVLNNLILNGIQTIDVKGVVEIMCEENNDAIVIQVKDSGRGIPKENLDKIFEPLFTTKQQGTGLGLASVQSIIESHGGIISVTSPPTVFTITLPKTNS